MTFNKIYDEIYQLKSSNEELAFEKLQELLNLYMKNYTCDNVFYLYQIDKKNNYQVFREDTLLVFKLLYTMFYDEEQFNEVSKDPKIEPEIVKYKKFLASVQFIQEHIISISFENENSDEVKYFHIHMNYCKKYLEDVYEGMQDLNNIMNELNNNLETLTTKLTNLDM